MNKLKEAIKDWNRWGHSHPWKAVLFAVFFTFNACVIGNVNATGFRFFLILLVLGLVALFSIVFRDMKKLKTTLPVALALIMAFSSVSSQAAEPPQPSPVGVGVGVVVVCAGGYCVYKLVKFCQRKFPKESSNTNSPPAFRPQGNESAASWNYGSMGSCDPTLTPGGDLRFVDGVVGTLFTVDLAVDESGGIAMRTSAQIGDAVTQSWTEFADEIARHGVTVTGSPDGSMYYATNGVPCAPEDVLISFDALTGTVEIKDGSGPVKLIEIERSRDLLAWHPFLRTKVGAGGRGLRIEDATTATSMFYKISVSDVP